MPWGWEADDKYLPTVSRLSLAALLALSCPILTLRTFPIVPHLCFTGIASLGILITCYLKFSMLFLFNQSSLLLFALIFVFPNQDFLNVELFSSANFSETNRRVVSWGTEELLLPVSGERTQFPALGWLCCAWLRQCCQLLAQLSWQVCGEHTPFLSACRDLFS